MLKVLLFGIAIMFGVECARQNRVSLKDFEFVKTLGQGRSGTVYAVRYKGKIYAMKMMEISTNEYAHRGMPKSIANELNMMKLMNNLPFVVHVYFAFIEGQYAFIVMDYVSQGSIESKLEETGEITIENKQHAPRVTKPLSTQRSKEILPFVLSILHKMHIEGYMFGDPLIGNFLVTQSGTIALCDFSVTKRLKKATDSLKFWKKSKAAQRINDDYQMLASEWGLLLAQRVGNNELLGLISRTDMNSVESLRNDAYFKDPPVDWAAVDNDNIAPFEAVEFVAPTRSDDDECPYASIIGQKTKLGLKAKIALRDFYYVSPNADNPRVL